MMVLSKKTECSEVDPDSTSIKERYRLRILMKLTIPRLLLELGRTQTA